MHYHWYNNKIHIVAICCTTFAFMSKSTTSFELAIGERPEDRTLTRWLREELRHAILDGRLRPGVWLPATRDFAKHIRSSRRGTAVTVFEELVADGYLRCQSGSGTWVNELLPAHPTDAGKVGLDRHSPPAPLAGLEISRAGPDRSGCMSPLSPSSRSKSGRVWQAGGCGIYRLRCW